MIDYVCQLKLNVEAKTPEEAAQVMWQMILHWPGWRALPVVEVEDIETQEVEDIDLSSIGEGEEK